MKSKLIRGVDISIYDIYKCIKEKYKKKDATIKIQKYLKTHNIKKLHIGCGGNLLEGWLNTDLILESPDVVFLDASKPFPIKSDTFEYIYSEHVFEHLTFQEQLNYLKESYRILKPNGKIRIATPNFNFLINLNREDKSDIDKRYLQWNLNTFIYPVKSEIKDVKDAGVYVINNYFRDWGHKLIHSPSSLTNLLAHAGFLNIKFEEVKKSSDSIFQNLEGHELMITEEFNVYETMVLEASK